MKTSTIFNFIKDIFSPKICYSCKKEWHFLCPQCLSKLKNFKEFCFVCKQINYEFSIHKSCWKNVYYDKIIILTHYKNTIIKKLIKDSKFYWKKDILEDFWKYLSTLFLKNEEIKKIEDYLIVALPMFFLRKLIRWYNQSEILAKYIWKELNISYNFKIIKKIKHTTQQSKLSKLKRENNLKNTFKINDKYLDEIRWKTIILVDDVVSTWTTINEISKLFKKNWVKNVIGIVIASD